MSQGLFIEAPRFEKVATVKLSQDSSKWPLDIIQHLHEEHPYLAETQSDVVFKKQDKVRGYGYGFLKIGDNIRVPLIVSKHEMKPLDVWLDQEGKTHVLSEDTIKAATLSTSLGKPVKPQTAGYVDSLIYSRTYPPYDGKYVYASANNSGETGISGHGYNSLLSALPVSGEEKKAFIQGLDPSVIAGMKENGTLGVLTDWMNDDPEKVAEAWEKAAAHSPEIRTRADDYLSYRARRNKKLPDAIVKEDILVGDVQTVEKFGIYLCEGTSGEKYKGHVFPNVHDFDLKKMDITIFTGHWMPKDKHAPEESCSAVQARIAGQKMPEDHNVWDDHPRGGDRGFFCIVKGDAAIALPPVKVISKSITREHHETRKETDDHKKRMKIETDYTIEKYHCQTDLGQEVTIIKSPRVKNVVRVGNEVHIPSKFVFCGLKQAVRLKSDPEMVKKAAEEAAGVNELQVRHIDGVFAFQGAGVSDYELKAGVSEPEAMEFLGKTWTKEASEKIVKRVVGKPGNATTIHVAVPRPEIEKTASVSNLVKASAVVARIKSLTVDFEKVAASLQDSGLVDSVLSLKFLSKENLTKYAEFIPQFEEATQHLADLLIASRIGLSVEEHPIKIAMENISEVVRQLRTVQGK